MYSANLIGYLGLNILGKLTISKTIKYIPTDSCVIIVMEVKKSAIIENI
jgi:hypothetical protein